MTNFLRRNWGWLLLGALVIYRFNNMPDPIPNPTVCTAFANETYDEVLKEAFADPSVWQNVGDTSPYEYAARSQRNFYARCMARIE